MHGVDTATAEGALAASIAEHREAVAALETLAGPLAEAADAVARVFAAGGRLLACGNGASAACSQLIAAAFVGRYLKERAPFSAIALTVNTSALTGIADDSGFNDIFARQVRAFGRPGDVLLAISASGGSHNVLRAVDEAHEVGMTVIGMTGGTGGALVRSCDVDLTVPASSAPAIREMHVLLGNVLCGLVEDALV
jgi:D-sedoheptulose 7-phosphate isomerase